MDTKYEEAKVLVVDDNSINLYVINKMLENYGITADCVPNGKACIKKNTKKKYDLIFMDHMMPEMDGIETFAHLKEMDDFSTPVVALTANSGDEFRDMYLQEGFADYASKPMEPEILEKILEKYLSGAYAEAPTDKKLLEAANADPRRDKLIENGFTVIDELLATGMPIDDFDMMLQIFQEESIEKMANADEYAKINNLGEYAVIVHGLKNDAAMISDLDLKEHALKHEIESKAGNVSFVNEEWPKLKEHWNDTISRIAAYFA